MQLDLFHDTLAFLPQEAKRLLNTCESLTSTYKWVRVNPKTVSPEQKMLFVIASILTANTNEMKAVIVCKQITNVWTISYEELLKFAQNYGIPYAPVKCKQAISTRDLVALKYEKNVPKTRSELEALPGIGYHTAGVILATLFDEPEFAVDLHVRRVLTRLQLGPDKGKTDIAFEQKIKRYLPKQKWGHFSRALVDFGQDICGAKPRCNLCNLDCPSRNTQNKSKEGLHRQTFTVKFARDINTNQMHAVYIRQGRLQCTCKEFNTRFRCEHTAAVRTHLQKPQEFTCKTESKS